MRRLACLVFVLFSPTVLLAAGSDMPSNISPDIPLEALNKGKHNVNEFIGKGKWTIVVLWAHDCPLCNQEIHQMAFFHDEHHKKDAIVLGVSVDGKAQKAQAMKFIERHDLDFTNLLAEPDQFVLMRFGGGLFIGTPTYYVYTPDGKLYTREVGPITQEEVEKFMKESGINSSKG